MSTVSVASNGANYATTRTERGPTRAGEFSIEIRGVQPVPESGRYGSVGRLFTMWVKMTPSMFFVGALATAPFVGLGLAQAAIAIVIANVLGSVLVGLFAIWGARTGAPQLQQSRLAFGKSVVLPSALQWITQIGFEALTLLFVAEALVVLFKLPFYAGAAVGLVCMGVISLLGYEVIHSFQKVISVVFLVVFAFLTASIAGKHPDVVGTAHGAASVGGFLLMLALILGLSVSFTSGASDYSRYLPRNTSGPKIFGSVFLALVLSQTWIELLGVAASPLLRGTSTMRGVYQIVGGGAAGSLAMVAMALCSISIMVFTDYSGALAAQAAGVKLKRPFVTVISALIAFGVALWLYSGDVSGKFEDVVLLISYWVTPWAAVVIVHWWRRGRFTGKQTIENVLAGPFSGLRGGWDAAASAGALVVGFFVALPFSDTTFDATVSKNVHWLSWLFGSISRNELHGGDLDFYVGFVVAGVLYGAWVLMTSPGSAGRQSLAAAAQPRETAPDPAAS